MGKVNLNKSAAGTPKTSPKAKVPKSPLQRTPAGKLGKKSLNKTLATPKDEGANSVTRGSRSAKKSLNKTVQEPLMLEDEGAKSVTKGKKSLNKSVAGTPASSKAALKKKVVDNTEDDSEDEEPKSDNSKQQKRRSAEPVSDTTSAKKLKTEDAPKKYSLFVGKLNNQITEDDIKEHFGEKATVVAVRIPTFHDSGKKRLFAFVEVSSQKDYEAALGLHQSHLKGSCITVEYTCDGAKTSSARNKKIKSKTLKLRSIQKRGILSAQDTKSTPVKKGKKKSPKKN